MRFVTIALCCAAIALMMSADAPAQDKVALTPIKYEGLKQEVLKNRGKVVVLDFWATNCPPCIEALPHYIDLQKKHSDKGLVVLTISVDPLDKPKRVEKAQSILTDIKSPLRNLILDEQPDEWYKKFDFVSLPFSYVFDRKGKWVRLRSSEFKTSDEYNRAVDTTILKMLEEK